ncbi:nose resistant to fluoxetine protein 6 [Nilaparvata lugens]|uniref:nose resistant to fluoxetine protein 6 n=1 Tax=Nilaparvata lugens TaxID=108931 RepID=UPI00193CA276|nr:nose resistant to fluoxetine protein 6 [Nilaparvata lugens]
MENASIIHRENSKTSWNCKRIRLKSFDKLLIIASLLVYNVIVTKASDSVVANDSSRDLGNRSRYLEMNRNFTSQTTERSNQSIFTSTSLDDRTYLKHRDEQSAKNGVWLSNSLSAALSTYVPSSPTNPDSKCTNDGQLYKTHLQNLTLWAVQMYDASVHFPEGLLSTDTYQLGHFDECLNVSYPSNGIEGKYCLATLLYAPSPQLHPSYYDPPAEAYFQDPPPHSSVWDYLKRTLDPRIKYKDEIHFGVCVPASCSRQDVETSLNLTVTRSLQSHSLTGRLRIDRDSCYVKRRSPTHTTGFIVMLVIATALVGLSLIGTFYDYLVVQRRVKSTTYESGDLEKTVLSFSLRMNAEELFEPGPYPEFDTLNGGKVITIFFIILGHRVLYTLGSAAYNPIYWEETIVSMADMAFMNGTHIVDTFFFCGGFLAFHGLYKELEKTKKFNIFSLIFLRYFRIMPVYAFMIGLYAFILAYLGNGPLWNLKVGLESANCRENWWLNLLFLNNYFNTEKECLLLSWYIACDMHFFIIGSFIVYYLWKNPKIGEIICIIVLCISIFLPFITTYIGNHDGKLRLYQRLLYNPHLDKEYNSVYIKSYSRSIPYMVGLALGYVTLRLRRIKYTVPPYLLHLGSWLFVLAYAAQIYSLVIYIPGRPYDALENATYAAMLPLSWSIGVGWIVLVQYTTGFGVYNLFFVKKIYTPLSRLVYCVVLIHPAVQLVQSSSNRNPEYLTFPKLLWMTFGDVSLSYFLALVMYLLIEAPLRSVVKLWIQGTRKRKRFTPTG